MTIQARLPLPAEEEAAGPGAQPFVVAMLRRLDGRTIAAAVAVVAAADLLGRVSRIGMEKRFPVPATHSQCVLLINVLFGACMVLALVACDEAVARGARRWPTYLGATLLACLLATWAQQRLLAWLGWENIWSVARFPHDWVQPLGIFSSYWLYCTMACVIHVNRRTALLAARRLHLAEVARATARRRTLESRLQAMQARVEPQFLFNTLAHVRALYDREPESANRMLADLIAYLRAALPHLRESSSTLGQEIALVRAYLDIIGIRLGKKPAFEIDVPERLAGARMPPMMLLPLVDHALAFGLVPRRPGGDLRISARAAEGCLGLSISAANVAFLPGAAAEALDGLARRLHALYGDTARFELDGDARRGTRATLEIPHENPHGRHR